MIISNSDDCYKTNRIYVDKIVNKLWSKLR